MIMSEIVFNDTFITSLLYVLDLVVTFAMYTQYWTTLGM